jgi:glycine/D-amino acid oxidase-like deaminating enzyme
MRADYDVVVIGGGFFGCVLARHLKTRFGSVLILEKDKDILRRASYVNQARVHNGYHYPRSLLTALRSRINFPRFVEDYHDCIDSGFSMYYAIARKFSNVTATQFKLFCDRIGARVAPAPEPITRLFDPTYIEQVFQVEEYAFDSEKLRRKLWHALDADRVEIRLETKAIRVEPASPGIRITCASPQDEYALTATHVLNCTYSEINQILEASGLPLIPLKHELTEIALVEVPEQLRRLGITVMCGPFFSTMPFPARSLHSLSHVRYTPHYSWQDEGRRAVDAHDQLATARKNTNFAHMLRDVRRYLPAMRECVYVDSLWEVKTVLPLSEADDSRPILLQTHAGLENLHCVMGGKIDNIYDALAGLDAMLTGSRA